MLIVNGRVFTGECEFAQLDVEIQNGAIVRLAPPGTLPAQKDSIDANGLLVLPGYVDIHSHGCVGGDFSDGDAGAIEDMLTYYGGQGVTTVVPATMSLGEPMLRSIIETALPYFDTEGYGAVLRGVNMEGPFINVKKKGAQNPEYIIGPALEMFDELFELSGGRIRLVDIAPELPGSMEFIRAVSPRCVVSLAHTEANYQQAADAFAAGASHVTHLFNAMPPFGHREPGVIGAASDFAAHVEVISDGIHLHPAVVRSAFRWFGEARICLISDSMRATGMPNGEYSLGGLAVHMEDGKATLQDGTIAGSAVNLGEMCRRAVRFGVPVEQAVRAASLNPARAVGLDHLVGSLTPGRRADIQLCDEQLNPHRVFVGGSELA